MKRVVIAICIVFVIAASIWNVRSKKESVRVAPSVARSFDEEVTLLVAMSDGVCEMNLRDYLIGVISAEMPASFPSEALKAQAIAARTFTLRQADGRKHPNADVCTDSTCCQGWIKSSSEVFSQAVTATDGLVLTYEGALIDATYFSCCSERTEAAVSVWGGDVPYLQSVSSPDESDAPRYFEQVNYSAEEFSSILMSTYPQVDLSSDPDEWFGKISYTKGGGIDTAIIGGINISGTELRKIFSLRSTNITFQTSQDEIRMLTYGYGHRVGMSQYGAKALAEAEHSFEEILLHYYTGVEIFRLEIEKTPLPNTEEV